jgi:hypothetical protein
MCVWEAQGDWYGYEIHESVYRCVLVPSSSSLVDYLCFRAIHLLLVVVVLAGVCILFTSEVAHTNRHRDSAHLFDSQRRCLPLSV